MSTETPASNERKILRIGILQAGKIVEERLVRKREAVTIGQSPKNTFYLPIANLPRELLLFDLRGDQYHLGLHTGLDGKASAADQVRSLDDLRGLPGCYEKGGTTFAPLDEKSRGKLTLGELTVLFQFVAPPPAVPKPQLPASARGGLGQALAKELPFLLAIAASFVVQAGMVALSFAFHSPAEKRPVQNRYLQALKVDVEFAKREAQKREDREEAKKAEEKKAEEKKPDEKPEEKPVVAEAPKVTPPPMPEPVKARENIPVAKRPAEDKPATKPTPEQQLHRRQQVVNKTILKQLVSSGGPAVPGSGPADALARGHVDKIQAAFDRPAGIQVGAPGETKGFEGGPRFEGAGGTGGAVAKLQGITDADRKAAGMSDTLKTDAVEKPAAAKKPDEKKVNAKATLGSLTKSGGMGQLDSSAVAGVFKRRSSAFRTCYESRLRDKPNLSGKIVIRFTIGEAGRITNIDVASNTTGDSQVGACIVEKVRGMRFDPPKGSVTFTYPIVLSKG